MNSSIQKRRDTILAEVYQHGRVHVSTIAPMLGVSEATVRRDLKNLSAEGQLELDHGGAHLKKDLNYSFISKSMRNVEEKKIIAQLAADMVADGDQIFLDSGTTCFHMASLIRSKKGLSVIVNSLRTARELQSPNLNVIIIGGKYRPERRDAIGPMANEALSRLRGYTAFIGCDGIGMKFGPSAVDLESAHLFSLAVEHAKKTIILADSSKFDTLGLFKISDWHMISAIITEKKPSKEWRAFFEQNQIDVLYPQNPIENQNENLEKQGLTNA